MSPGTRGGGSESTKYTNMQSEYGGNLTKIKLLEARIIAYDMRELFIISTMLDEYDSAVKERWGNHATTGVYLLSHWLKVSIPVVARSRSIPMIIAVTMRISLVVSGRSRSLYNIHIPLLSKGWKGSMRHLTGLILMIFPI